jgi:hypothetical protein
VDFYCTCISSKAFSILQVQSYFLRLSKVESIPCILDDERGINTDDKTKSELLNTFFQSVFTVEADSQNAPTLNQRSNKKLSTIEFNPEIIQKHLEKLKVTKSPGPDQMYPKFLNETSKSISTPSAHIFYCG